MKVLSENRKLIISSVEVRIEFWKFENKLSFQLVFLDVEPVISIAYCSFLSLRRFHRQPQNAWCTEAEKLLTEN